MEILVLPKLGARGRPVNLRSRQVIMLAFLALVVLPAVVGLLAYHIHSLIETHSTRGQSPYQRVQEERLVAQEQAIDVARRDAETHLNALAHRLGIMQAQIARINALGDRLVRMANLDRHEFDFSAVPAMGGPEAATSLVAAQVPDFLQSLERLSVEIDRRASQMEVLETLLLDRKLSAAVSPHGWPTQGGWVSSSFGLRTDPFNGHTVHHNGVDIAADLGSPIEAMARGIVSHAGPRDGYGLAVEINHGNGVVTRYAHASEILVHVGDRVEKGKVIAKVGSSGRSTGPHLHFEVLRNGQAVNPRTYLREESASLDSPV